MQQKYKVLSFAIVAALYIFLVPSTSHAYNFKSTHTPGETVGPASRAAIPHNSPMGHGISLREDCERRLVEANRLPAGRSFLRSVGQVGLGFVTRYIQSTGGYCYYYQGGTSSGASGPNTWRYDPR